MALFLGISAAAAWSTGVGSSVLALVVLVVLLGGVAACMLVQRHAIRIDSQRIELTSGPLPPRSRRVFAAADVVSAEVVDVVVHDLEGRAHHSMVASLRLRDGTKHGILTAVGAAEPDFVVRTVKSVLMFGEAPPDER